MQCAEHIVDIISTYLIISELRFCYIYIYKLKNDKQTCSRHKLANVSSENECHKIDPSSRVGKTEHTRSRQNVPAGP